jgi:arginyl-tRNA synthetase
LLDLARLANEYYAKVKILSAPEDVKKARLYLIQNMVETLSKVMDLIGMKFLERM